MAARYELSDRDGARFWSKVVTAEGCWSWRGGHFATGYALFSVRMSDDVWRPTVAHRVMYRLTYGPIPDGLQIDHLCRNRACVNPSHLEAVTSDENKRRGFSPAAVNARREVCPEGHALSEENAYRRPRGGRECRICMRNRDMSRVRSSGPCVICGTPFTSHNRGVSTCSRQCTAQLIWQKRRST